MSLLIHEDVRSFVRNYDGKFTYSRFVAHLLLHVGRRHSRLNQQRAEGVP
jgi:hypothetical protein